MGISNEAIMFHDGVEHIGSNPSISQNSQEYIYSYDGVNWLMGDLKEMGYSTYGGIAPDYGHRAQLLTINNNIFVNYYDVMTDIEQSSIYYFNSSMKQWEIIDGSLGWGDNKILYAQNKYYIFTTDYSLIILDNNFNVIEKLFVDEYEVPDWFTYNETTISILAIDSKNNYTILNINNEYYKLGSERFNEDLSASFEPISLPINYKLSYNDHNNIYLATPNSSSSNSFYYSTNLENWETINTPFNITPESQFIIINNNMYCLTNNQVYYSNNRINWILTTLSSGNWKDFKEINGYYFIVKDNGLAYTQTGDQWYEVILNKTSDWKEIKYIRGNYWLYSNNGDEMPLISYDLNVWNKYMTLDIYNLLEPNRGIIITAEDCQERHMSLKTYDSGFIPNDLPAFSEYSNENYIYDNVICGKDKYIIHGRATGHDNQTPMYQYEDDVIFYSYNGINWMKCYQAQWGYDSYGSNDTGINKILFLDNQFYALNHEFLIDWDDIYFSIDGITWEGSLWGENMQSVSPNVIKTNNGKYIDINPDGDWNVISDLRYSDNLIDWTLYNTDFLLNLEDEVLYYEWFNYNSKYIAYSKKSDIAVAITINNKIYTSLDTVNWTSQTIDASINFNYIECFNDLFVISSTSSPNQVYISYDGLNWELTDKYDDRIFTAAGGKIVDPTGVRYHDTTLRFKDEAQILYTSDEININDYSPYVNNTLCICPVREES